VSKNSPGNRAWLALAIFMAVISLPLALIFFGMSAASGGGDCAVTQEECATIARWFGLAALLFIILEALSIRSLLKNWKSINSSSHGEGGE